MSDLMNRALDSSFGESRSRRRLGAVVVLCAVIVLCGCEGPEAPETPTTQGAVKAGHTPATVPVRVRVAVKMPGASPEHVEQDVTVRIEVAVMAVTNVAEVRSVSREGVSEVDVEFAPDVVADEAAAAVWRAVASASAALPADSEEPIVTLMDAGPLAASIAVYGDVSGNALYETADKLRDGLASVPDIGRVELIGEPSEVRIEVSGESLHRYGLTMDDIQKAVRGRSILLHGSTVTRPVGQGATDIGQVVVAKVGGKVVRLADVARISEGLSGETTVRISGKAGALVQVHMLQGRDAAAVLQGVRAAVARHESRIPKGVRVDIHDCSPTGPKAAPLLRVTGDCPGMAAKDVERRVTGPIGLILREIEGVASIHTVSRPGRSMIHVVLKHGTDLGMTVRGIWVEFTNQRPAIGGADVRLTVEPVPRIPIGRIDVRGGTSADDRLKTAERLRQDLVSGIGVARVDAPVLTPSRPTYEMAVKRKRIAALGLTAKDVTNRVRASLGAQETVIESTSGRLRIVMQRGPGRPSELKIRVRGRQIPLNELVELQIQSRQPAAQRVNGKPCVTLAVFGNGVKKTGAIVDAVRTLVARAVDRSGGSIEIKFQAAALSGG